MKRKDYVFYIVSIHAFSLLALSPIAIEIVFAPDAPVTNVLSTWLVYGENFVNSMVYTVGF